MNPTQLVIAGASGRMGRMLFDACATDPQTQLVGALDASTSPALGVSAKAFGGNADVTVVAELSAMPAGSVLIDFTRPEATLAYLDACVKNKLGMVIGTTGFDDAGKAKIAAASKHIPIVFSPNYSVGVNTVFKLLELAAKSLDSGYDIEIVEMHHRMKVDAPSGTAIKLGEVIAEAQGTKLSDRAVYERVGHTGEREAGKIGFATLRGGDVVGDHTVVFAGIGERIEISHKSASRATYAVGAIRAAKFLQTKPSGLYDMFDVLGLR
ncbi:MAG: 4-hydroxy-tetrahydrodipicolinate reductase [Betaproteobacteria bacterium]|nr:MAG: 4-hydroxy-tetrahydrodipicolinate reductase [Betaproteobacteria bacterium]